MPAKSYVDTGLGLGLGVGVRWFVTETSSNKGLGKRLASFSTHTGFLLNCNFLKLPFYIPCREGQKLFGVTAGIGKTRLGREGFNILRHLWTPPTEWTRNGFQGNITRSRIAEIVWSTDISKLSRDNSVPASIRIFTSELLAYQFMFDVYELGHYKTHQTSQFIFVQTFLSGTAPHIVIRAKEPTSYSWRSRQTVCSEHLPRNFVNENNKEFQQNSQEEIARLILFAVKQQNMNLLNETFSDY
ncbi:10622_t:CDS:10 [Funneliformis caledonium]|uniref:10622_t:CDS:1 n=1 Tax=Funneliformis caledonium TaxID=1117310 RepID=A0A9N8YPR4_9GLOM|nr:10622_t:CDS:10 [Funneliformis caledonium]